MRLILLKNTFLFLVLGLIGCMDQQAQNTYSDSVSDKGSKLYLGAERMNEYLPLLNGKKIGVVANQTTVLYRNNGSNIHLVDSLLSRGIQLQKVFAPEHGFRGEADAGELVKDGVDTQTGLPIVSLYGKNKKPSAEQLQGLDWVIFDIQDVGARFYTYISTLHYVMEACAEQGIAVMVLDRPNPNGHYVDGPVLEVANQSFVGMHPVPVVHGMTVGEYAQMINGQKWLKNEVQPELKVIQMQGYSKGMLYSLPIRPSPNLPNDQSINLYPSLCFFEGTPVSAGRGTETQFQVFGAPFLPEDRYSYGFTPVANTGAKYPKFKNEACSGIDLRDYPKLDQLNLKWLIQAYQDSPDKDKFFNNFFVKLAGTDQLQQQIKDGWSQEQIRESWQAGLSAYREMSSAYRLYPD
ncbi:exo-beta-N-acetylmuramidase NamZ family protein [Aureitalea marina]|uniref:DUF1343 domain-containing protein n=1 Tax=Aureitalea marina TaxID=930804 RepID=A0A2S7KQI7_9FLAO|nr:DUF1343 domain-containing protein [Aureitalea marina]PQB04833.1 hypothetical protein BST85_07945 [Aureitalea marina]